jgi:hypothetical protein
MSSGQTINDMVGHSRSPIESYLNMKITSERIDAINDWYQKNINNLD